MEEELSCSVSMILKNSILPDVQLQKIKEATLEDTSLQQLSSIICSGWSARRTQVPSNLEMYWNFHDELSVADGIILKGEKMLIPTRLQKDMLTCIHTGHMGVTKCIQRAKEVMFWPGMSKEIEHVVLGCDRCQEYRVSNTKEPILPGPTPDRPWDIVATDLFQWENRNYLLIVDYYSRYFERAKLEDLTSTSVINHTKSIFARHGIPTQLISDNDPQFSGVSSTLHPAYATHRLMVWLRSTCKLSNES